MSEPSEMFSAVDGNVAANVRMYREAAGLSQEELAQRMTERGFGFSQATIWKIERSNRPVRISEALALADALDLGPWGSLIADPKTAGHEAQLHRANRAAYDAYHQTKAAAAAYLRAQTDLAFAARHAYDHGVAVSEVRTSWLDTPPERAVIEARVEGDDEAAVHERLDDAVDQVLQALRDRGYEAILDPAAIEVIGGGPPPTWTPPEDGTRR